MQDHDPFARLGLERRFDLDPAAVRTAYLRLTAKLHPDRISDPVAQAEAAEQAARVNAAYRTLLDDEARADALLVLYGGPRRDEEKTLPDGFLVEMMEIRQEMEEVLAGGSAEERKRLADAARAQRAAHVDAARSLLEQIDRAPNPDLLRATRIELNAWRYVERMIEQLDPDH